MAAAFLEDLADGKVQPKGWGRRGLVEGGVLSLTLRIVSACCRRRPKVMRPGREIHTLDKAKLLQVKRGFECFQSYHSETRAGVHRHGWRSADFLDLPSTFGCVHGS